MESTFLTIVFLLFDTTVNADQGENSQRNSSMAKAATAYVVNLEFCSSCLSEEDKEYKETVGEVHTYAALKNDLRADLPSSFTICSSVMTTYGSQQILFNLLGNDGNKWLGTFLQVDDEVSLYHGEWAKAKLPPVFAHQWVRSCMAVNSESGLLQWVVDGTLVENTTVAHFRDAKNKPSDLTGRIVLGGWQNERTQKWILWTSNQVTNLNIFSTALTIGEMQL